MKILILGATSAIARATAAQFAQRNAELFLASRDTEELARISTDLTVRYSVNVHYAKFNAVDFSTHESFWLDVIQKTGKLDGILLAFGDLGKAPTEQTAVEANTVINSNFTGVVSILNHAANYFEQQKQGFIIGISSVAGDRGRQSNYIYGAAKAGLSIYLQGLCNRLFSSNVQVITIKPGFVDTPMTYGKPGLFLVVKPEYVAKAILNALDKKRDVVYVPSFWRLIMLIIKLIPERIFKRMKL